MSVIQSVIDFNKINYRLFFLFFIFLYITTATMIIAIIMITGA